MTVLVIISLIVVFILGAVRKQPIKKPEAKAQIVFEISSDSLIRELIEVYKNHKRDTIISKNDFNPR